MNNRIGKDSSQSVALFIGKFQPPHVGHILTARRLLLEYDKIIIGVTESLPNIIPVKKVLEIFKEVLGSENVGYQHIKGAVDQETAELEFAHRHFKILHFAN